LRTVSGVIFPRHRFLAMKLLTCTAYSNSHPFPLVGKRPHPFGSPRVRDCVIRVVRTVPHKAKVSQVQSEHYQRQLLERIMESNYLSRDTYGMYKNVGPGPGPALMGADTLIGNDVYNMADESLGSIKELMIEMSTGKISYAVLSYGGFLGVGDRLFAVPWAALKLDTANKRFTLNATKEQLKNAPGFDKDHWPSMADTTWASDVHKFYGVKTSGRVQ
jgi:hypothetical protein